MHQDARLRSQLVDDAPLHDAATAARFVRRIAEVYRARTGLGIRCCPLYPGATMTALSPNRIAAPSPAGSA